jgi:cupin fold WbuC family metalloprotein
MREVAPGIFHTSRSFVLADRGTIELLRAAAARVPYSRARLCAHPAPHATQHDMLIVSLRDTYVAPHRHPGKTESFVVIEGAADCLLFTEDGTLETVVPMAPAGTGQAFFYRMPSERFHSLRIRSPDLVFVESTIGPFRVEDTENAPWAPGPKDEAAGRAYIASLFGCAALNA